MNRHGLDKLGALSHSRRTLLGWLGGYAGATLAGFGSPASLRAKSQPAPARVYRIGRLTQIRTGQDTELIGRGQNPEKEISRDLTLNQALRGLGYVEGQNLITEYRAAVKPARLAEFARELAELPVDVILAGGDAARPAVETVKRTPIVILIGGDPIAGGFVRSLAHPGGNVTGPVGQLVTTAEKRLRLLKQTVPSMSRVAALWYRIDPREVQSLFRAIVPAARALGLSLDRFEAQTPEQLTAALEAIARSVRPGTHGLMYTQAGAQFGADPNAQRVVDWANAHRLPAVYPYREYVEGGGLMEYGWDSSDQWRRAAGYIDKILRGANPGDLPMEGPTEFQFIVNLNTARTLGLSIPRPVLEQMADQASSVEFHVRAPRK